MEPETATAKFYAARKPCKYGHAPLRYTRSRKCVDCAKSHSTEWAKSSPAEHRNRSSVWAKRNRPAVRKGRRERYAADPDKFIVKDAKRRAAVRLADGHHTPDDRRLIFELQNAQCFYCDRALAYGGFHGDHYIALSKGGSNARYNIVAACVPCNVSKRDKNPVDFALSKGFNPGRRPAFWNERPSDAG